MFVTAWNILKSCQIKRNLLTKLLTKIPNKWQCTASVIITVNWWKFRILGSLNRKCQRGQVPASKHGTYSGWVGFHQSQQEINININRKLLPWALDALWSRSGIIAKLDWFWSHSIKPKISWSTASSFLHRTVPTVLLNKYNRSKDILDN